MTEPIVGLSPLDKERFGVVTARCPMVTSANLGVVLQFCRDTFVELLVVRCAAVDYPAVHAIEAAGARLVDTLVFFARDVSTSRPSTSPGSPRVRPSRPEDAASVRSVAAAAFSGYLGHYHTDARLDRSKADETYADWAERACLLRSPEHEVLLAEENGTVVGFLSLRMNAANVAEIVLNGVHPAAQGTGVYGCLLAESVAWGRSHGATRLMASTQLTNWRVQRAWVRAGFELFDAQYTFHLWFC